MLCTNCNAQVGEGSSFCSSCGRPIAARTDVLPTPNTVDLPPHLMKTIVLRPKERITGVWSASRQRKVQTSQGETDASDPGYLVSSNHRLFFIKESGLLNKSYSVAETIPLESLTGVTVREGLLSTALIIAHDHGETTIENLFEVRVDGGAICVTVTAGAVQHVLNSAAQARLEELDREKQMGRVQYVLDFSFLKAEMEKGGIVVQTIKCPACSAGMTLPSSGSNVKCPYCGSMVYAQDIFEKVKGLIGTA